MYSVFRFFSPCFRKFQANFSFGSCSIACSFNLFPGLQELCTTMKTLFGKALSPTAYLLLAILQLLQYSCKADAGNIEIAPTNQRANLSDTATFHCRATGSNTLWHIGGKTYDSGNMSSDSYTFRETTEQGRSYRSIVHNMYLEMRATVQNNGTEVRCIVFVDSPTFSDPVTLIVQGGPAAPVPRFRAINSSALQLEWDVPFTWEYTSIDHYKISVNNSMDNWNRSSWKDTSLLFMSSGGRSECRQYTFTVLANNGLSDGDPGRVSGGFPIDPTLQGDTISANVTFRPDFTPIIHLAIKLPVVCPYQEVQYMVSVSSPTGREPIWQRGPISQLYAERQVVSFTVEDQSLKAVKNLLINTNFTLPNQSGVSPIHEQRTISIGVESPTTSGVLGGTQQRLVMELVVPLAAVGGAMILIVAVFSVVLGFICCAYKKKRSGLYRTSSPKRSPMVTNPIYEGQPVYETIDPRFRTIPPPPTPTNSRPLIESPYSNSTVDPSYAYPHEQSLPFPPSPEEAYTVMNSAGGLGKTFSDTVGESSLDRDSSEVDRYVPEPSMIISEC